MLVVCVPFNHETVVRFKCVCGRGPGSVTPPVTCDSDRDSRSPGGPERDQKMSQVTKSHSRQ